MPTITAATDRDWRSHGVEGFGLPLISHIAGNLWMGGCVDRVELDRDFTWVMSLHPRLRYTIGPDTRRAEFEVHDMPQIPERVESITTIAMRMLADGKTLIHCQAGMNRSGLVAALALIREGRKPADAVALLREKRSPWVLWNRTFENYVLNQSEGIRS